MDRSRKFKLVERFLNYFVISNYIWGYYIIVLTPWLLTRVGMSMDQWSTWVIEGTPIELIVGYPLLRIGIWLNPKIERYNKKLTEKIFRKK